MRWGTPGGPEGRGQESRAGPEASRLGRERHCLRRHRRARRPGLCQLPFLYSATEQAYQSASLNVRGGGSASLTLPASR